MNYLECTGYLDRLGNEVLTMKFGLETIRKLLDALGNPQSNYPSVLVAGTNGKGSVARFISSICSESGLKTGLFTSPHLVSVTERLTVNGEPISRDNFARQLTSVVERIGKLKLASHPTFFETITATALNFFSEQRVDIAVLEVGLGGRLDSTNAVEPILSILTEISYDHQQYLGNTLELIATEKAGILRAFRPALSLPQAAEVRRTLRTRALEIGSLLEELDPLQIKETGCVEGRYRFVYHGCEYQLGTWGQHQILNAALAVRTAEELQEFGFTIHPEAICHGIQRARVPGVLEKVSNDPQIFLDGGHNPRAVSNLVRFLEKHTFEPRKLVFAIMKDKMVKEVLTIAVKPFQEVFLTQVPSPRTATIKELQRICPRAEAISRPDEAYRKALSGAATTVVAGSFHLVGEILKAEGLANR